MFNCCTSTNKSQVIRVDFGRVSAGTTTIKSVKISNESCKKLSYEAQRDPTTNPLDYVFNLEPYTWTLQPGGTFKCKIRYRPITPFYENTDYFSISTTDCDRMHYKIVVHGICIGPKVSSSVTKLIIVCPKGAREAKKRMEFNNNSDVTANFMFDIDERQCPFKLDVLTGFIEPHCHVFVTITYSPTDQGLCAFYLPCLIHNQSPIITELYGYYGPLFCKEDEFHLQIFTRPMPKLKDFEGYMSDSVSIRGGEKPPISLSYHYLDFGQAGAEPEMATQNVPQTVCFTNHSLMDLLVKWDKDTERIFNITPHIAQVRAEQSALFEAHFTPTRRNTLCARELVARIFWEPKSISTSFNESPSTVTIPLVASVRMIGHTFPAGTSGWIPQYEVPQTVILPPCVPPLPVHTTFLIRRYGHLPMTFRFIPPRTSHFAVKPMVGIMYRDYQIIALEMFPEEELELVYVERWAIHFNGNPQYEVTIDFRGYAEYPNLSFSDNGVIDFAPVHPGCLQVKRMTMRNMTRHCIRYSFPNLPPELCLGNPSGEIHANEILTDDWLFCPPDLGEYGFKIECNLTTLKAGYPVGTNVHIQLRAVGRSEPGFLAATPEELNFGAHAYGEMKKLSFHVFNFSAVKISFKMICKHRGWPIGDIERDVRIHPKTETICPGKNERIDVCITPQEPGFYQLMIQYFMRRDSMTEDTMPTIAPRDICKINCMCILPIFKVKDLLYKDSGPNIGKVLLWKLMEVNKFNTVLRNIMPGEKKEINMVFPVLLVHQRPFLIKLLLVNPTPVPTTWSFRRIQLCSCKKIVKTRGFNFRYMEYDCEHRLTCSISPRYGSLTPNEQLISTIELQYILVGTTKLQWELTLSNNRQVIINAEISALNDLENSAVLLYSPVVDFEDIYIGDMDPIYQIKWIYNNMDHDVEYAVDVGPLHQINEECLTEVFSCRNACGIVPSQSYKPVIIKFQPRKFDVFEVNVPVILGSTRTELLLRVESNSRPETRMLAGKMPIADEFFIPEVPVYFNMDHVLISSMPMHSIVSRMIMIYNDSKKHIIDYQYKSYELPGFIRIEVIPRKGRIHPGKPTSLRLSVYSGGHPCKISADITCEFLDVTNRRKYEKSVLMYNALCKELEGQFTITEKGVTVPKPWFEIAPKPVPFHKAITVSCYVCSSMDNDLKITLQEQLNSAPAIEIPTPKNEAMNTLTDKEIAVATFILEGMLWDILDSTSFKNTVEDNLMTKQNMKYAQFVMNPIARKKLMKKSYNIPSQAYVEAILESMIFLIVHEEFGLDIHHIDFPPDIRQTAYQRLVPQIRHQIQMETPYNQALLKESASLEIEGIESGELTVKFRGEDLPKISKF